MARPRKKKSENEHLLIQEEPKTDWEKWLAHLEENYKLYVAGVVFLILCVAIGALIRGSAVIREQEKATSYAEAALIEDASERLAKYEEVLDNLGKWKPEALYRMGETAIEAEQYDKAEEAFNKLLADYPNCEYVPNAKDGLAFLAWNKGDLEAALKGFEQVAQEYSGQFIAKRKQYDIGQILEEMERIEDAIAAYKKQVVDFPDSAVARKAQQALDRLKEDHPDLFPEEEGEGETAAEGEGTTEGETATEGESASDISETPAEGVAETVTDASDAEGEATEQPAEEPVAEVPAAEMPAAEMPAAEMPAEQAAEAVDSTPEEATAEAVSETESVPAPSDQ